MTLVQRLDLPAGSDRLGEWAPVAVGHVTAATADRVTAVLIPESADQRDPGYLQEVGQSLVAATGSVPGECCVDHVISWADDRWRNVLCQDPSCCPPEGRPVDPALQLRIQAEFAGVGCAPLPSRRQVEESLSPDQALIQQVVATGRLEGPRASAARGAQGARWRAAMAADLEAWVGDPRSPGTGPRLAHLLAALRDLRVRDGVLDGLSRMTAAQCRTAGERLTILLRAAPEGDVAPVGTVTAVAYWLCGDGARAGMAVDRARGDDPDYSLAVSLSHALSMALPPEYWRAAMRQRRGAA